MALLPVATTITSDEPAYSLAELNITAPHSGQKKGTGWYRYQIIRVVRGDKIWEYRERLGPAGAFKCIQFFVPGGLTNTETGHFEVYHNVGELKEVADNARLDGLDNELAHRELPDYGQMLHDKYENMRLWRKGRSTFGAQSKTQRSGI